MSAAVTEAPAPLTTTSGWQGARALLRGPLRTLVTGQSLGQAGDGFAQLAFAQVVLFEAGRGATPWELTKLLAVTLLPFCLVGPIAGVVIDRWDRRRTMSIVSVVRAGIALAAISVLALDSQPLAYLGIVLLLSCSRFVLAGKGAALPRTVVPGSLVTANAISSVAGLSAAFLGAVIASTFVSAAPTLGFVVAAALYVAAAIVFSRLPPVGGGEERIELATRMRELAADLRTEVRAVTHDAAVRNPLVAVWGQRFLVGAGFILLVLIADERYDLEASGYGLAIAVTGVAAFGGTVAAPVLARRWSPGWLLPATFLVGGTTALIAGFAPELAVLIVGVGVAAFAFQVCKIVVDALVGRHAPDLVRGRVFSVYDVLYNVAFVLAALALVPLWGPGREDVLLWGLGVAYVLAGVAVARAVRGERTPISAPRAQPPASAPPLPSPLGWHRCWPFAAIAAVVVVLGASGAVPRWPGLTQLVAVPPLDLFADVRLLTARASSIPVFAVGVAAAVAVRAAVLAVVLGWSRTSYGFALRFELVALVPALLAAGLDASGRAVLYVLVVAGGLLVTLGTFFLLAAVPWAGASRVRQGWVMAARGGLRAGVLVPYLVAISVLGAASDGDVAAVVLVPVSAAITVAVVVRLATTVAPRPARRAAALAALVALVGMVGVVVTGGSGGDETGAARAGRRAGTLVLVPGVDTSSGQGSMFELDPRALGFDCARTVYYSYRGPGDGAPRRSARCPIRTGAPYRKADTLRPLDDLAAGFTAQVAGLEPPITVVTHSQGAWIAWRALSGADAPRADAPRAESLVMLAPFPESLAEYAPDGETGTGAATGAWARLVTDLGREIGFNAFDPDRPLAREVQARAGAAQAIFGERLPARVRALAILARPDLPLVPGGMPDGVMSTCPGWGLHGGLPRDPGALSVAARFLAGRDVDGCPGWVRALARPAAAFGAPVPDPPS